MLEFLLPSEYRLDQSAVVGRWNEQRVYYVRDGMIELCGAAVFRWKTATPLALQSIPCHDDMIRILLSDGRLYTINTITEDFLVDFRLEGWELLKSGFCYLAGERYEDDLLPVTFD